MANRCHFNAHNKTGIVAKFMSAGHAAEYCIGKPWACIKYDGRIVWRGMKEYGYLDIARADSVIRQRVEEHRDTRNKRSEKRHAKWQAEIVERNEKGQEYELGQDARRRSV